MFTKTKDKKWPSISKGGPGSGRYPAGSGEGDSGKGNKGKGKSYADLSAKEQIAYLTHVMNANKKNLPKGGIISFRSK